MSCELTQEQGSSAHGTDSAGVSRAPAPMEQSRLLDMPAELRCYVFSLLLPSRLTITLDMKHDSDDVEIPWYVWALRAGDDTVFQIGGTGAYSCRGKEPKPLRRITVPTELFRVNKLVSNETQAILYGSNTYRFIVHGNKMSPQSLRCPKIFGCFGYSDRLSLLRRLRNIHIEVVPDTNNHWAVKRQRSRLAYFVEILKEHADDENQKSLLCELTIDFNLESPYTRRVSVGRDAGYPDLLPRAESTEMFMFSLESLACLQGIRDVKITGLPDWYEQCLQLCIQGKGGKVQETDWPLVEVKRRKKLKAIYRYSTIHLVSTRKWYQPTLDWKEYAERNEIPIPDDIDKFWIAKE
ncbi:hypothetical protein BDW02DRAFT_601434 [Decorospora gaudefroyi]|uniref:F-box domain-containing protein n=1 Tax=Decorospora gaudefroyi TaxID=184978 RepID=A0A6A5K0B1_9PLEO|nr:hypothetical protein BDW02DRAFT_601434 [Decorospora gaudefroyi]